MKGKPFLLTKGPFAGKTVELAPTTHVDAYADGVARVLEALGHSEALVTDESTVGHFVADGADVAAAAELLGIALAADDFIWMVAARLRPY